MVTEIDKKIIEKVKKVRLEKGVTQYQLADQLELNRSFVSRVESGKYEKKYNIAQLNEIAKILECSLWDLIPEHPF